jgi:hypothetical protein
MSNEENVKTDVVVEVQEMDRPVIVDAIPLPKSDSTKKKFPAIPVAVGAVVVVIALILTIVVFSQSSGQSGPQFGNAVAISNIKITEADSEKIEAEISSLTGIEAVKELSGVVLDSKKDSKVAQPGDQVNISYSVYAYAPQQSQTQPQQSAQAPAGPSIWQYAGSSIDEGQTLPIIVAEPATEPGSKSLSELVGESSGSAAGASTTGQSTMLDKISFLLDGQSVGTVIAFYIPPQASAQGQTPGQLIIGVVTYIGAKGDDPDAPEVTTEVPSDAPELVFEDGKPTSLTVPETFIDSSKSISEVVVNVLSAGSGAEVKPTDTVSAVYAGYTLDGKMFDASFKHGDTPSEFSLERVIKGWKAGLAGQKIGSKVELLIPSQYAYGTQGSPQGGIDPNAFLVFYVEIVDSKDASAAQGQGADSGYGDEGADY